jgi:hypothetical protein
MSEVKFSKGNRERHWQEWVNLGFGLWVMVSPWTIAHVMGSLDSSTGMTEAIMWNHYATGAAVVLLTAAALGSSRQWEEWLNIALGIWLLVSPWVIGFTTSAALMLNAAVVGGLIVVFAGWSLMEELALRRAMR